MPVRLCHDADVNPNTMAPMMHHTAARRFAKQMPARATAALLAFGAGAVLLAHASPAYAAELCRKLRFEGADYVVCEAPLAQYRVRTFLNDASGQPFGGFSRLLASPAGKGVVMAMNGGMYRDDRSPVGLYVEGGKTVREANARKGAGNFHMMPNGVFYVGDAGAGVLTTAQYLRNKPKAISATQSGPMLVINGKLHPRFSADGPSLKMRNGVGVRDGGKTVVFAISEQPVSFGAFGRLFRDRLRTPDALYLDGTVSSLYAAQLNRRDWLFPMGPIIAVSPLPARKPAGRRVEAPARN